ncbi:MAG: sulfotransferase [Bryobacteraceae bacterium]
MEHLLVNRRKGEFLPAGEILSFAETLMADALLMRGETAQALEPAPAHAMSILLAAEERGRVLEAAHAETDRLRCEAEEREGREGRHPAVLQSRAAESVAGDGENLIFVISQPRAGSTMLQKVLSAHPEIHTVSEPWIALHPLFALRMAGIAADYNSDLARTAIREFLGRLPEGEEAYWEGVRRMLTHLYGRALREAGKRIFLDKTPRYYFVIPELRRVFPRARFLFLLRNPLAVLASILDTWVRTDSALDLRNYRHDLMAAPALLLAGIRSFGPKAMVPRYEEL